jgi:hypothetical protein
MRRHSIEFRSLDRSGIVRLCRQAAQNLSPLSAGISQLQLAKEKFAQ